MTKQAIPTGGVRVPKVGGVRVPKVPNNEYIYNVYVGPLFKRIQFKKLDSNSHSSRFLPYPQNDYYFDNYFHAYAYFRQLQLRGYEVDVDSYIRE